MAEVGYKVLTFLLIATLSLSAEALGDPPKKVIVWGGIDWYSPEKVRSNIREIERLPFDGMVLQGFTAFRNGKEVMFDWQCFGDQRFEREELAATIQTLKNTSFRRFTDNFLRYNVTPGNVDWFDDFEAILHNARMWAEVTKELGMKGWMFDVEDYKGTVFNYQKMKYRGQKSFAEYASQVRLRGHQFMEAVQSENPDIVLLLCLAHSYVNRTAQAGTRLAEIEYGLIPAFLNGMIEAAKPPARIIDGNEQGYGHLTADAFAQGRQSTRDRALELVPPELRAKYRSTMEVGMAVFANYSLAVTDYPGHWPTHYLSAQERMRLFEQNIYDGLRVTDEYVWLYSEHIGWWERWAYPTPPGAVEAIRSARDKARSGGPLGFRISSDRIGRAEATVKAANPYPSRSSKLSAVAGQVPVIDGSVDETVWQRVPLLLPFVRPKPSSGARANHTEAKATFDDEHLYFAFRCVEQDPKQIRSAGENKDDAVARGDCVEVFIKGGERNLPYHFIVNPNNVRWDGKGDFADWDGPWRSGTRIAAPEWTAEIAIPWATIDGPPPPGRSLRVLLCRRYAGTTEVSAVVQELSVERSQAGAP